MTRPGAGTAAGSTLGALLFAPAILRDDNETALVADYLGGAPGTFIEVGAHHPEFLSQTLHLETAGWHGILIEPLRENADLLRQRRKARVFEVAAGAPESAGMDLPMLVAGAVSTLGPAVRHLDAQASEVRMVPLRTVDSILGEAGMGSVDFISIDVEGEELAVLRGFALEKYRPRLVLLEDEVHRLDKHRHLLSRGYKLVRRTGLNNWYVPAETPFPVSLFGRLQFLRKLYLGLWLRRFRYALACARQSRERLRQPLPVASPGPLQI